MLSLLALLYVKCNLIDGKFVGVHLLIAPLQSVEVPAISLYDCVEFGD